MQLLMHPMRKMSGYINDILPIYRVSGDVDTINCGEKSERRKNAENRQKIADISALGDKSSI